MAATLDRCAERTRPADGGLPTHKCQYKVAVEVNGKKMCLRHARIEALYLLLSRGDARTLELK